MHGTTLQPTEPPGQGSIFSFICEALHCDELISIVALPLIYFLSAATLTNALFLSLLFKNSAVVAVGTSTPVQDLSLTPT